MTPLSFLQFLLGDDAPGSVVLWTRHKKAHWLSAGDLDAAGRLAEELATSQDVYFGVALQDKAAAFARWRVENPGKSGEPTTRGYGETAIALPGLRRGGWKQRTDMNNGPWMQSRLWSNITCSCRTAA